MDVVNIKNKNKGGVLSDFSMVEVILNLGMCIFSLTGR